MDNNEYSELLRLKSPHFPALGDVFIVVSAGDYRTGGIPHFFGEFFIFSTKEIGGVIGQRVYLHQHLTRNGSAEVFALSKVRATAELSQQVAKLLSLKNDDRFDGGLVLEKSEWDYVETLCRAGILPQESIREIEQKTRSSYVVKILREMTNFSALTFEEAKNR
ncbi:hypothetical protein QYH69_01405 [Paraburkholderia sp. SARCC-3016]|uniref:hypothetical protein n=1 Tax=Paraburkholderia sp. SARCC-3016 TaxID=3058611 RepID=UPI002809436D|nr:hypothetical protein [Paraburkholderia sp. SARCC-3016]MDQ7975903.1 hypothetical protein [Paraburkholderia sp. SARCC-3016]